MSCWRQGHPVVISLCEKNSSASFCKAAREKKESFIVTYSGDDIVAAINRPVLRIGDGQIKVSLPAFNLSLLRLRRARCGKQQGRQLERYSRWVVRPGIRLRLDDFRLDTADQDLLLIDFDTSAAGNSRHSVRSQARGARAL